MGLSFYLHCLDLGKEMDRVCQWNADQWKNRYESRTLYHERTPDCPHNPQTHRPAAASLSDPERQDDRKEPYINFHCSDSQPSIQYRDIVSSYPSCQWILWPLLKSSQYCPSPPPQNKISLRRIPPFPRHRDISQNSLGCLRVSV